MPFGGQGPDQSSPALSRTAVLACGGDSQLSPLVTRGSGTWSCHLRFGTETSSPALFWERAENCCNGPSDLPSVCVWSNTNIFDLSTSTLAFLLSGARAKGISHHLCSCTKSHGVWYPWRRIPTTGMLSLDFCLEKFHRCFLLQRTDSLLQQFSPSCRLLTFPGAMLDQGRSDWQKDYG